MARIRAIFLAVLVVFFVAIPLKAEPGKSESTGLVMVPAADLRASASDQSERVTQAILGTPLDIDGESGIWWHVTLPSQGGYPGWIKKADVYQTPDIMGYWKTFSSLAVVTGNYATLTRQPDAKSPVVESLPVGSRVGITGMTGNWYKTALPGGREGWVPKNAVQPVAPEVSFAEQGQYLKFGPGGSSLAERVIETSKHWLGAAYVWGGMSPAGFDCSGFTYTAYWLNGILLPRDAAPQYQATIPVKKEDMRPGDLLFFSTYAPGPTHVGIYLGDGTFINAKSIKSGVVISKLDEPYFAQRFLGARRPPGI